MNDELNRLFAQIHAIEDDIERRLDAHRAQLKYRLAKGRAVFDVGVKRAHRRLRTGALRYHGDPVCRARSEPVDLSMDLLFGLGHQPRAARAVCRHRPASAWISERDRKAELRLLRLCQRHRCLCPRGRRPDRAVLVPDPPRHADSRTACRYKDFVDYGDAEGYRARLEELRAKMR
jgi:hypothetical protein